MTLRTRGAGLVATAAAAALVLAACNGGGDGPDDPNGDNGDNGEAVQGGEFSVYQCQPQNLITGNSTEVCGSAVLEQLYSGLTSVDWESGEALPLVAQSWDSDDAINWTFTLNEDFTFHNGDPVTAQTFVDTWNWVVDPDNAQQNANFYDNIAGYDEVVAGDAEELSGVQATDEFTLEIELTEPFSPFPQMLSYTGFYPLPDEAFEDIESFQNAPIGNGRYEMDGEWVHDQEIAMTRYEDWAGEDPGLADRIVWSIYSDLNTAYLDVQAGELDLIPNVSPERIATAEADFGENTMQTPTSSFEFLGIPLYQEELDDPDVRHALSMAIDRETLIETIFDGARVPATAVIPPALDQHREDACEYCSFDPEAAADLYEAAGGPSEVTLTFNSGVGHEEWTEAVANMWQENLPIDSVNFESLEFAQYLDLQDDGEVPGPFRLGWVLSYPSPQYAMEPIYGTGGSSNYTEYSNEDFDDLIAQANAELDLDAASATYQAAEDQMLEDMPVIPLWYRNDTSVFSDRISGLEIDPRTFARVESIQVNE